MTDVGADGTGGQVSPPIPGMRPVAFRSRSPITLETTATATPPTIKRSKSRFTIPPPYRRERTPTDGSHHPTDENARLPTGAQPYRRERTPTDEMPPYHE